MTDATLEAGAVSAPASPAVAETPAPAVIESAPAAPAVETPAASPAPAHEFVPSLLEEAATKPAQAEPAAPEPAPVEKAEGEEKPGEAAPEAETPTPEAPPVYEFTYPEGVKPEDIDQERFGAFTGLLGENKMPGEAAQKLLDLHVHELQEATTRLAQHQWDVFNRQQDAWKTEIRSDPEIGGSRLDTAMKTCGAAIEQFGGSQEQQTELRRILSTTGAGNNPLIVKFFHRVGEALAREGSPVVAPPARSRAPSAQERGLSRYKASGTPGA